jgi:hypothetical protein
LRNSLFLSFVLLSPLALAQAPSDPAPLIAAQREAMAALFFMDGVWRGPASIILASGEKRTVNQTERIGPFLDGSVKVIEGRGYGEGDKVTFNAFGIISYDPAKKTYSLRSYAMGQSGDFAFTPTPDGYIWEIPAGPAKIRYTATVKDNTLHEVGDRIMAGRDPIRFFEMKLTRVGNTDWPAGSPVSPR